VNRPELECCTPILFGKRWVHSFACTERGLRGQAIRPRNDHPAGKAKPSAETPLRPLPTWLLHPEGCACPPCAYVDAHLDDDDDRTLEVTR